jgi:hypothetical protein
MTPARLYRAPTPPPLKHLGYPLGGERTTLRWLAHSFFHNSPNPGRPVMATFDSYFAVSAADREAREAQRSGAPIMVVAGYLGHVGEWLAFEQEWKLLLDRKGLRSFEMAQFVNLEEPYATWSETEREEFIQSLLATIRRRAGVLVAWAIEMDDWQSRHAKAYTLCALACIATVSEWVRACGYAEKISHIFDGYGEPKPDLSSAFRLEDLDAYGIVGPKVQPKRDVAPLQAARILAHQTGCARDKRRMGDNLAPYFDELYRVRGYSGMLKRELLDAIGEEVRIADLPGMYPLWPFAKPPVLDQALISVSLMDRRSTLRVPKGLDMMFAEREPKDHRL